MLKVNPHPDYPPEDGRYIRGNDFSPVAVAVIDRFRQQIQLVDLQLQGDPELVHQAVWAGYQEAPVDFRGYSIYDMGAFPEPPLSGRITWRVTQPWAEPANEQERKAMDKARQMIEALRNRMRTGK